MYAGKTNIAINTWFNLNMVLDLILKADYNNTRSKEEYFNVSII